MGKGRRGSGEREQERRDRAVEMAIDLVSVSQSYIIMINQQ